jgi:hypothetical protein
MFLENGKTLNNLDIDLVLLDVECRGNNCLDHVHPLGCTKHFILHKRKQQKAVEMIIT